MCKNCAYSLQMAWLLISLGEYNRAWKWLIFPLRLAKVMLAHQWRRLCHWLKKRSAR
jgi:hypothetical protein